MAVAEACIIKSFRRGYISCNLYYSKYSHSVSVQNQSYKMDFICKVIRYFHRIIIVLLCSNSICKKLHQVSLTIWIFIYPIFQRIFRKIQTL